MNLPGGIRRFRWLWDDGGFRESDFSALCRQARIQFGSQDSSNRLASGPTFPKSIANPSPCTPCSVSITKAMRIMSSGSASPFGSNLVSVAFANYKAILRKGCYLAFTLKQGALQSLCADRADPAHDCPRRQRHPSRDSLSKTGTTPLAPSENRIWHGRRTAAS